MKKRFCLILLSFLLLFVGCQNTSTKVSEKEKPVRIGISWERDFSMNNIPEDPKAYIDAVKKSGAEPILLPQLKTEEDALKALKLVDAIILTGGEDINPKYYKEEPHANLEELKDDRDVSDIILAKTALKEDFPILATCRGMQILNTILGGTLYQDLPTQYDSNISHRDPELIDFAYHSCKIIDKESKLYSMLNKEDLTVNSWHHQGIKSLGKGLKITALSPDGIIEGVELEGATFVVGVQFHPEWHVVEGQDEYLPVFYMLNDYAKRNRDSK